MQSGADIVSTNFVIIPSLFSIFSVCFTLLESTASKYTFEPTGVKDNISFINLYTLSQDRFNSPRTSVDGINVTTEPCLLSLLGISYGPSPTTYPSSKSNSFAVPSYL